MQQNRATAVALTANYPTARLVAAEPDANNWGGFRATEYDYFQEQIVRLVMNRSGKPSGQLEGEFTDWTALSAFVDEFWCLPPSHRLSGTCAPGSSIERPATSGSKRSFTSWFDDRRHLSRQARGVPKVVHLG